jgi:hypothetical protein
MFLLGCRNQENPIFDCKKGGRVIFATNFIKQKHFSGSEKTSLIKVMS